MDLAERGTCLSNGCGSARCASAARRGIKPPSCAPTIAAPPPPWPPPCSPAGRRKTSSSMPDNTIAWTAWPTIAPRRFPSPYRWSTPTTATSTGRSAPPPASSPGAWPTSPPSPWSEPIEPKHVEPFIRRKAALQEEIEALQGELATLKAKRKATPHHIAIDELPEEARFRQLSTQSKQLVDTIKMIAYRAETAMANCLREHLTRPDEARRLLCALYTTEADLLPDPVAGTLTVRLHHSANAATDQAHRETLRRTHRHRNGFPADEFAPGAEIGFSVNSRKSGHLKIR